MDYTQGGARRKDSQRTELIVDKANQERAQKVPPFRRQETATEEQWETIQTVKQTIGTGLGGAPISQHQYEVPLDRSSQNQVHDQKRRSYYQEERGWQTNPNHPMRAKMIDKDGDRRTHQKDVQILRGDPTLLHKRDDENSREREKTKEHFHGPSSTSTPQRSEARALTPDLGSQSSGSWEREMLKNINQISITGGLTKLQSESFLLKQQEEKRVEINTNWLIFRP